MKQLLVIAAIAIFTGNIFTMCQHENVADLSTLEYHILGGKVPGYVGTKEKPEWAEVYNLDGKLYIQLPKRTQYPVIDWPEEFDSIMHQTGEINSYMHFWKTADTLHVDFEQN